MSEDCLRLNERLIYARTSEAYVVNEKDRLECPHCHRGELPRAAGIQECPHCGRDARVVRQMKSENITCHCCGSATTEEVDIFEATALKSLADVQYEDWQKSREEAGP